MMKRAKKSSGFSLVEVMVALIILVMLTGVINVGVSSAMRSYNDLIFESESDILASTITVALSDILRYAEYNQEESEASGMVRLTNADYGISKGALLLDEGSGRILVDLGSGAGDESDLVNEGAYTSMVIKDFQITYKDGLFSGSYKIERKNGQKSKEETFTFRTLKAKRSD